MSISFFVTGTGTGVGKTLVSAILTEAFEADYWKPVQAGFADGTDSEWVKANISNSKTRIHPEVYRLQLAASPHIAAREESVTIDLKAITDRRPAAENLIVEGAGGLMVPLNEQEFVIDLIKRLRMEVVLVSKNELGSINHSILTAEVCRQNSIPVAGWIFNGTYMHYEDEIVRWTGIPRIASVPFFPSAGQAFIMEQASLIRQSNFFHAKK